MAILATFTGRDKPGLTAQLTEALANRDALILDITQALIHDLLTLSILFDAPEGSAKGADREIIADLLRKSGELGLKLETRPIEGELKDSRKAHHYAVTLIADRITARSLHQVTAAFAREGVNIDTIKRLSEGGFGCVEMAISSNEALDSDTLRKDLLAIARKQAVDIALQSEGLYRRAKRLVVMDMDSTLIQAEVIDELAREKGVYDEVAAITHEAMNGKIDFDESLRRRCSKLAGLDQAALNRVLHRIQLTPGAEDLICVLKKLGYKIALLSGGFTFVADRLRERLGIDFAYANTLEIQNGALTGKVLGAIVNAQRKADLLEVIAQQERIELDQVIAVGDGANDLLMLAKAGLGIAFNAKPAVSEQADLALSQKNLRSILYLIGLTGRDLAQAIPS